MASFIVLCVAILGCLAIFDLMGMDTAIGYMLKFGAGIVLLGVCNRAGNLVQGKIRILGKGTS